jgi:hypothetical protein
MLGQTTLLTISGCSSAAAPQRSLVRGDADSPDLHFLDQVAFSAAHYP